jgi:hypothetical protein
LSFSFIVACPLDTLIGGLTVSSMLVAWEMITLSLQKTLPPCQEMDTVASSYEMRDTFQVEGIGKQFSAMDSFMMMTTTNKALYTRVSMLCQSIPEQ